MSQVGREGRPATEDQFGREMETGFAVACSAALVRAVAVAVVATSAGAYLAEAVRRTATTVRRCVWAALVVPLVWPAVIPGYAFGNAWPWLTHHPWCAELVYAGVLVAQTIPLATVIALHLPPAPVDAAAWHLLGLLRPGDRPRPDGAAGGTAGVRLRLWLCGPGGQRLAIGAVVFVWVFQEFEVASLMRRPAWTVWLFDAQASGMFLSHTMYHAAVPMLMQLPAVVAVVALLRRLARWRGPGMQRTSRAAPLGGRVPQTIVFGAFAASAMATLIGAPLWLLSGDLLTGGAVVWRQRDVLLGVLATGPVAGALALCAWALAGSWVRGGSAVAGGLLLVPVVLGLSGSLVTGLLWLAAFQLPGLSEFRGTVIPYAVAQMCLQLPRAVVLRSLAESDRRRRQAHVGLLLGQGNMRLRRSAARVLWHVDRRFRFAAVALLAWWIFFELTVSALLNPILLEPIPLVLYNQMHYGHVSGLTVMVLLVTGLAAAVVGLAFVVYRVMCIRLRAF